MSKFKAPPITSTIQFQLHDIPVTIKTIKDTMTEYILEFKTPHQTITTPNLKISPSYIFENISFELEDNGDLYVILPEDENE